MSDPILTTSWDDGHPADLRLAELLHRHGIAATFYVPLQNSEGRPVMTQAEIRSLAAAGFEIGSHTAGHVRLDRMAEAAVAAQIRQGKEGLEQCLGQPVRGFCLPGGRGGGPVRRLARELGLSYVRTVEMFRLTGGQDPLLLPTTAQVFPHPPAGLLRNLLRRQPDRERLGLCFGCLARPALEDRLLWLLDQAVARGGVLHLWGHAWEVEALDLWPLLDRFFARAAQVVPAVRRVTNAAVMQRVEG